MAGGAGITRRGGLRACALGAAAVAAQGLLEACAAPSAARPGHVPAVTTVYFQTWIVGVSFTNAALDLIQGFTDSTFNAGQKSIRAVWQPSDAAAAMTAIIAGAEGPALLSGCCGAWPALQPFLAPLDTLFRQHNIDTTVWPAGALSLYTVGGSLRAVPNNSASQALLYRQDILDGLGLPYPEAGWDYTAARQLWSACSLPSGPNPRVGFSLPFGPPQRAAVPWTLPALVHGFGGAYMSADGGTCLLDQPGSADCVRFFLDLMWSGVADGGGDPLLGGDLSSVVAGRRVFVPGAASVPLQAATELGTHAKWDFIPYPRWPAESVQVLMDNYIGINAAMQDLEYVWQLFDYVAVQPEWARFITKISLNPPAQAALQPEWVQILRSVAPVLQSKNLEAYLNLDGAARAYYNFQFFASQPETANRIFAAEWNRIWNRRVGVTAGLTALAQQINAFEAQAAAEGPPPTVAEQVAARQKSMQRLDRMFGASG